MAPSVTSSAKGTPTLESSPPGSNDGVVSPVPSPLELSPEGMLSSPGADGGVGDAHDQNYALHRSSSWSSLMEVSVGASSSLLGTSVAGVASSGDGDMNDEKITYGLNSSPELQNCWRAVAESASAACSSSLALALAAAAEVDLVGERSVVGCDDNNSDYSSDENDENIEESTIKQRAGENLAKTHPAFKDPFPSLSPMPSRNSVQSNSSLQSNCDNLYSQAVDQYIGSFNPITQHKNPQSITQQTISSKKRSSTGPYTPPHSPLGRATAPTPYPLSVQITPIKSACNSAQKLWIDPFPTPDVSALNSYSTPCSSRVNDDLDGEKSKILNADWDTLLKTVPQIPVIEELNVSEEERTRQNVVVNTSCPRLHSMFVAEDLPVRKVSSESNLFPLIKRRSLDDLWGALSSGPDGNDFMTEYDNRKKSEGQIKRERRKSEKGSNWSEPVQSPLGRREQERTLFRQDNGLETTLRPRGQEHTFQRSSTAPMDPSWEGLRKRPLTHLDKDNYLSNNIKRTESNIATTSHLTNHSRNTITNVTGAELAKEVKKIIDQRGGGTPKAGPLTPNRLSFRAWKAIKKSSRAVATAKNSAGELVFSPVRTVHIAYRSSSLQAKKIVQSTRKKLKEQKERRRQRRLARMKDAQPRSWWIVIPADHPYKITWDYLIILWALLGAYRTHVRIRDRVFDQSPLILLTEIFFTVDILLNFVTEHKTSKGQVIRDGKAVWARYLTTWFLIDILSLIPWERIYLRPVVEKIKRRNFFQKTFFRSKAVVRVSRVLRGRHIKLFGRVSKQTGTPLRRLVRLVIKYLPKYLLFLRNMKGALVVRALRFVHWLHNMYKKIWVKARNARRTLVERRSSGHPIFSPIRPSIGNDSDSEDYVDDDDEDEELDTDGESLDDDENKGGLVLRDENDYGEFTSFHRARSEGSPLIAPRRRSFSQNEMWRRD